MASRSREPADLDDVVTDLGTAVSGPLRERLAACLADSAGDVDEATELVRAAYREWKTQRIDDGSGRCAAGGLQSGCVRRRAGGLHAAVARGT